MAAKFVVALTCFALCHSSPVVINGYAYRDGRAYSIGQGYTNNNGGQATGSASINGGVINAYGNAVSNDMPLNRNLEIGEAYPGQAVAKAEVYDTPPVPVYGYANAVSNAQAVPTFYAVPAPATIVSYEQNFEVPTALRYEIPVTSGISAQSSAVHNGISESSITSVQSDGSGIAESSAKTQGVGSFGVTTSNVKSTGGSAYSDANNVYGASNTVARTQGFGLASSKTQNQLGLTSSESQSNGVFGSAVSSAKNAMDSAIATSDTQGHASASSNVDINNVQGVAVGSAKTYGQRSIHWRFGSAYDAPARIGQVHATSQSNGGSAKSAAQNNGFGTIQSTADTQGYGSAQADANGNGYGAVNSVANANGFGNAKSTANINGFGLADTRADIGHLGYGEINTSANSNGLGSASSTANTGAGYVPLRASSLYGGYRTSAQTSGNGSASSSAKTNGYNTAYRVINSSANTFGQGSAQANANA